ncbi:hypothetical protein Tco_0845910 [Tanacetum coccineum]
MWTMTNKLKPKPITDVKIYPNSKPAVLTVYRGNDRRNFDTHNPFRGTCKKSATILLTYAEYFTQTILSEVEYTTSPYIGVTTWYERLRKIPKELEIQSALPARVQVQASSKLSRRKRKKIELEHEI